MDPLADPTAAVTAPVAGAPVAVAARGIRKRFGSVEVLDDVSLAAAPGSMLALLGPSGCGKTTLLRVIAGLEEPDAGEVRLGDRVVTAVGAPGGRDVRVPPEQRRVGMVFQDWALFPHLSVARNVAYGLAKGTDRDRRVVEALAMVGLEGLGDRLPATLSGGQQQRVALARAIAPEPSVLLLDEPFSNLDTALRVQVRTEVHQLLVDLGITTVFVTHDQEEAFVLGDQVAVMSGGRIVQQGTPAELYRRPATRWVGTFVGEANLVRGRSAADGAGADTALGRLPLEAPAPAGTADGAALEVLVRPESLEVDAPGAAGAAGGVEGQVVLTEYYGHDTVYVVRVGDDELRVRGTAEPRFQRGDAVAVRYAGGPTVAFAP